MTGILSVWAERIHFRRGIAVCLIMKMEDGRELLGKLTFEDDVQGQLVEGRETIPFPPRDGKPDGQIFLQAILDHAWEMGMRPNGLLDTTESIGALKNHLHDLRVLVFKDKIEPKA